MNWTRYKLLIISGGVTVVLSGALLFWILSTRSKNADVSNEIQQLSQEQSRLSSQKLFPSKENFELLQSEQAKVIEQRNTIEELLQKGQLKPKEVVRSRFSQYISAELVPSLRNAAKNATKGGEHGVILKDPDFGLTEYLKQGVLPENSKIPEFLLELQTMEVMSKLLFSSGISELLVVQVVEDESDKARGRDRFANAPAFPTSGMNFDSPESMDNEMQGLEGESDLMAEKKRLFTWKDYRLEFRVYEDFLWSTINNFISTPNTFVIKELSVTNSNEMLWPTYLKPVIGKGRQQRQTRRQPRRREPMTDLERMLMGADMEATEEQVEDVQIAGLPERRKNLVGGDLLNMVMVVRVYRLIDETSETEPGL